MKGDFSRWGYDKKRNHAGVLHQQGRVLTDADWNAQTRITANWQDQAGNDIIGPGVAAVPADEPLGFKVQTAAVNAGGKVELGVQPGRVWADGLLTYLAGLPADPTTPVSRAAAYLQPPTQDPPADESSIGAGVRDAVVLEVWREAINGFQMPESLIEPALGGPDTTERMHTAAAFRLFRLQPGDTCESILDQIKDDPSQRGTLTVSLQPTETISGDCPVTEGGGYTGFEHHLYRVEIAPVESAEPMFKWSRFNGGLVGRGIFDAVDMKVQITANKSAIATSGITEFYMEVVQYNGEAGYWEVTYGAEVTLDNDHELVLPGTPLYGSLPAGGNPVFFRLWNGIRLISDFPLGTGDPTGLRDGIRLEFETPGTGKYRPGDYWTFPVRAGEIANDQLLIDNAPPEGIEYHRVPLAILNWNAAADISSTNSQIQDCRLIFQPLTQLGTCCTIRVGDGIHSHGDFDSIQEAVNHLPASGGQICLLPGQYTENVVIAERHNVIISGCGARSRIVSGPPTGEFGIAAPVIHVKDSQHIRIESLAVKAHESGIGVLLEGSPPEPIHFGSTSILGPMRQRDITVENLHVAAATKSAIQSQGGQYIRILENKVEMADVPGTFPGIYFVGEDARIDGNDIRVHVSPTPVPATTAAVPSRTTVSAGMGGIQIGGTSERVHIGDNLIEGGIGNGITLGSVKTIDEEGNESPEIIGWVINVFNPCSPCEPGEVFIPRPIPGEEDGTRMVSAGALYEIQIENNRIYNMGLNGIGVIGFFDLSAADEFISVHRLDIISNDIRHNLWRPLAEIPEDMINSMGYGGISLADVEYLLIQDNVIEDNGPNHLEPICGIFILHGEGVDITNNRILNNGAKTGEPVKQAKDGRRGGINIVFAVAPTEDVRFGEYRVPRQDGVPALKVHSNVVSVPLGQALSVTALGPVMVTDNQFTSRGMILRSGSPTFVASTVAIMNLGVSNEYYGQLITYGTYLKGHVGKPTLTAVTETAVTMPRQGLDDQQVGRYLANGNVMFHDNQCVLDLLETGLSLSLSSILILTLDDVSFGNNQCDCSLVDDIVLSHAILFGFSLRMNDNRMKEGLYNALYSGLTLGIMNATTNNQSTHCIMVYGLSAVKIDSGNRVLFQLFAEEDYCNPFEFLGRRSTAASGSTLGLLR